MNRTSFIGVAGAALLGVWGTMSLMSSPSYSAQTSPPAVPAPELVGKRWFNTPDGKPITLASRRGKVTVVEFWTFGCSNCRANLPAYARWQKKFASQDVEIIGVHTPEMDYERDPKNVEAFLRDQKITYPVVTDENSENWGRWNQQYWPTVYLVDKAGRIRLRYVGELQDEEGAVTQRIEELVKEPAVPQSDTDGK